MEGVIGHIAKLLEKAGFTLRSGGADGADKMFENGVAEKKEIYLPWKGFNGSDSEFYNICKDADETVDIYHPNPDILSAPARKLMARNAYQVLGTDLKTPSDFVLCWTPGGLERGGTSQAIRIAKDWQIPVFNLFDDQILKSFTDPEFIRLLKTSFND